MSRPFLFQGVFFSISVLPCMASAQTFIESVYPEENALAVSRSSAIVVVFKEAVDPITLTPSTLIVNGSQTGLCLRPTISYDKENHIVTFTPTRPFKAGEVVTITLTAGIKTVAGDSLMPYSWRFTIGTQDGTGQFAVVELAETF